MAFFTDIFHASSSKVALLLLLYLNGMCPNYFHPVIYEGTCVIITLAMNNDDFDSEKNSTIMILSRASISAESYNKLKIPVLTTQLPLLLLPATIDQIYPGGGGNGSSSDCF